MPYIGAYCDDDFKEAVAETARIEGRTVSNFIRIAIKDRVLIVRERYGLNK